MGGVSSGRGSIYSGMRDATYGQVMTVYGPVAPDVAYLKVSLTTGTVLTLQPVRVYGIWAVGFAAPGGMIDRVTAYARHGMLAVAVPFHGTDQGAMFNAWLRPGQPGLPRATAVIGDGTYRGKPWSVVVYQGPWGRCLEDTDGAAGGRAECMPGTAPQGTAILGWTPGPPQLVYATASAPVDHVSVAMSNGKAIRVAAVAVGEQKYFAFLVGKGVRVLRWTAYDRAGQAAASGGPLGR